MSRKNNGSILIITVFVFLLVNIIAINCSALILSNTRYTRYDYEEVYMKEQCLGKIELIYSNILKEVDKTLTNTNDYDSFKEYIVSDNFLNRLCFNTVLISRIILIRKVGVYRLIDIPLLSCLHYINIVLYIHLYLT